MGGAGGLLPIGPSGPKVPPVYGPYEIKGDLIKLGLGDREMRLQTSIEVPPDRGTIPLRINAYGNTFDSAAEEMQKAFTDLKKIGSTAGCGFKIGNYDVPNSSDKVKWKTGGSAEVFADVAGLDPDARITRANLCFKALREYILGLPKYDGKPAAAFEVLPPWIGPAEIWSVENLDKHRDALVTQANERLKAVQKADAKMWDHGDMQCTSAGVVTVVQSSSHAVTLQLEMLCPVSTAEAGSGPGKMREGAH
jgi:hypothetical protein